MAILINNKSDLTSKLNTLSLFFRAHYEDMLISDFDIKSDLKLFDLIDDSNAFNNLNNDEVEYILDNLKVKLKLHVLNKLKPAQETKLRRKI